MINYTLKDLFYESSVNKQIVIVGEDFTLTNEDIFSESMEINESLNSSLQLQFGSCESSSITFTVANVINPLIGKWIDVYMVLDGHTEEPFKIGRYCIVSDKPNADRTNREIIAYDLMYYIINADMLSWYNSLPSTFTFLSLRNSFFSQLGITQETTTLPNDSQTINKTDVKQLSGLQLISSICELNGCFGHIGRDNKFHYIYLEEVIEGLYPANDLYPANNLYPKDDSISQIVNKGFYVSAEYEDYRVQTITTLRLYDSKNNRKASSGSGENIYNIKSFLVDGLVNPSQVCLNAFNKIKSVWYMPSTVEAVGNLCLEVGDSIRLNTSNKIIYTYILSRTLKGIQSLKDNYYADGEEYRIDDMNGISAQIASVSAEVNAEVSRATSAESGLSSSISGVSQTVTSQGQTINTIQGNINNINGNINNINGNINNINGSITNINTSVTNINSDVTNINSRITTMNSVIAKKIEVKDITADVILGAFGGQGGTITIGTIRASTFQIQSQGGYSTLALRSFTDGSGRNRVYLGTA